jgi:hypothetical protein
MMLARDSSIAQTRTVLSAANSNGPLNIATAACP